MTTLNQDEFSSENYADRELRAEEHDYVVTVNDSGFFGKDNLLIEEEGDPTEYDVVPVEEPAEEPVVDDREELIPEVETSASEDDVSGPVPEALGEHREGESVGEWLRNDWERTKQDLHLA